MNRKQPFKCQESVSNVSESFDEIDWLNKVSLYKRRSTFVCVCMVGWSHIEVKKRFAKANYHTHTHTGYE